MLKLLNNRFLSSFYTLVTILSLNWFLPIFDSMLTEVGMLTRFEIIGYVVFAFLLELLVYFLITTFYEGFGANHLSALVLSLILAANLLAFLLSFYDPFLTHGKMFNAIEMFLLVAVFYWLCFALAEKRYLVGALSLLYIALVGQQIIGLAISKDAGEEVSTYSQFKKVKFEDKPNIYLVSFDALTPTRNAVDYLGIDQPAYVSVLENNGARIFINTFSDYSITDHSLNSALYLDPDIYRSIPHVIPSLSGLVPSPVYEMFRNNGYKINAARGGWQMLRGKYIDEFTPRVSRQSYCMFSRHWYYIQHLGYCTFREKIINKYYKKYFEPSSSKILSFEEQIFDEIKKHSSTQQPWFHFVYIFSPGHVPRSYTRTEQELIDYRKYFIKNQKETAQYVQMLIDHIRINDPTGIVLIFGDHGPKLSRGLKLNDESAQFIIRDRHGVVSAVYPGDTCSSYLGMRDEKKFITPSGLVRQLITCLSGGDDPVDWDVDYSGPYKDYKFEDFLYE